MANARWNALQGLVAVLQGITTGAGFQHDLDGQGIVTSGIATRDMRLESANEIQLQVEEGQEDHIPLLTSPNTPRQATLELKIDILLKGRSDEHARLRLNKMLEDISLAVGQSPTLGGTVQQAMLARIDEPEYHPAERLTFAVVRLVVDYHYTAGVDS